MFTHITRVYGDLPKEVVLTEINKLISSCIFNSVLDTSVICNGECGYYV